MKFFIVFACALAAASAGHIVAPLVYGAQHLPVIGPNGVPVDTADVQIARAQHLAHKVEAHARNGDWAIAAPVYGHAAYAHSAIAAPVVASAYAAAPVVAHHAAIAAPVWAHATPAAYPTTAVLPQSVNGVPLETPEVNAARINHYAAHVEANARSGHAIFLRKRRGLIAAAPIAYAAQHLPIIGANGVPVDTAEVQIARAQHLAHKIEAHARNGDWAIAAPVVHHAAPVVHSAYAAPIVHSAFASPLVHSAYAAPWAHAW